MIPRPLLVGLAVSFAFAVPEGTEFTVSWHNGAASAAAADVAKIDPFNQVPILIGMELGESHHDHIRKWCGAFTDTFSFRITSCFDPMFLPVDCGG
jgi:hypothetical protein